jgi:uncharacterized protein YcbK (DUF882 family)|tara:strand:- start:65 stop:412 length:348 start_codon:yes stop_codon:yes gene_type:complete
MEFKYFKLTDFDCQETGENKMDEQFIHRLDDLREACGFPFVVTSGFRSNEHSLEKVKAKPGQHCKGIAADIRATNGVERYAIVSNAVRLGFSGVGVAKSFIHVDVRTTEPVIWSY